ncbi:MAG: hypothetical protein MUF48_11900 [Pirellulaceae bacterium]|jgi:hypothetical protein|nr:hypothetical protein [Pirellulaceae bacterium]
MLKSVLFLLGLMACLAWPSHSRGQEVLFEDTFDTALSDKWKIVGLQPEDYRVRDGALELRVKPLATQEPWPMLSVDLPFTTADSVVASVEVSVVGQRLQRGEFAGLCLLDPDGVSFMARKTNIDGYFVLAPGKADFIGEPGQEGEPGKYTVTYWPADESFGPLRILVRGNYAHFQAGPSATGKYRTFFHSAIRPSKEGLGFGLLAAGGTGDAERWVRFDKFRVVRQ